jgi:hypothetical protein
MEFYKGVIVGFLVGWAIFMLTAKVWLNNEDIYKAFLKAGKIFHEEFSQQFPWYPEGAPVKDKKLIAY